MKIKQLLENTIKNPDLILTNLVILIAALGIFISPLVVDYATLPKGYELPKVFFWQATCLIIIVVSVLNFVVKIVKAKKVSITIDFLVLIILMLLLLISALFSPFQNIAIIGNEFRFQGLFTYSLMISAAYCVYKNINKTNWHFIALAFVLSGVNQAYLSYGQYTTIVANNPDDILAG